MSDSDNVRVALRIRPLSNGEQERGCQAVVERTRGAQQVVVNRNDMFTYNFVFDANSTQQEVYNAAVVDMLDCLFRGYNATILAYGQTGSGKTHTMGTAFNGEDNEQIGVIPRAIKDIFVRIKKIEHQFDFCVTCSFMELYQEQLFDLLSGREREQSIVDIREDKSNIIIPGLTERAVLTANEAIECLVCGSSGRAVAATAMNKQSSRSHAIFTLTIQATAKHDLKTVTTSKFHLVDLAGSERNKKTQATGERFKEGVKINQGLLALGNVISAFGTGQGTGFVSYRDSKLTRLLQDSLGGNSVTLMIACVSPADYNVGETLSTLRYADRARKIKNKPIVNQDPHAAEINKLKAVIQKLRLELLAANGGVDINSHDNANTSLAAVDNQHDMSIVARKAFEHDDLSHKYNRLQLQLQAALQNVAENEMRAHIAEASHEKLRTKTMDIKSQLKQFMQDITSLESAQAQLKVKEIYNLTCDLDDEFERTHTEINAHKLISSANNVSLNVNDNDDDTADEDCEGNEAGGETIKSKNADVRKLMREESDAFTNKQMDFNKQLQRINRELNLKEQLQQRVLGNMSKFCTLENLENVEEKFRECESKIAELEAEKSELMEKLRHHSKENISAKLAEERRRRLQALEIEISDMKKRNLQQAKLLKVREKEALNIKNLHHEIQAMKECKVKLIRAMRTESENFRQWKLTREKELMQLRNNDRKRVNEMARKEALHTKQRNVLKRKCEEAMAINKRLKVVLERQKVAQTQRQKLQTVKDASAAANKIDQVLSWVDRELEVIITQIDAEHTLEQLMADRGIISARIKELQAMREAQAPTQHLQANATLAEEVLLADEELTNLEEELEMRNAQIADLQQKVCAIELDTRMRSLADSMQTVSESKAVLKHILSTLVDMRRQYVQRILEERNAVEEQKSLHEMADKRHKQVEKRMRLMAIEHEEHMALRENTYEEKIAVLLRELHSRPQEITVDITPEMQERLRIQTEQLDKMDSLREELEYFKQLVRQLQDAVKSKRRTTRNSQRSKSYIDEELEAIIQSSSEDSNPNDPDWGNTPLVKRNRMSRVSRRNTSSLGSNGSDTSMDHSNSIENDVPNEQCSCKGKCMTRRCKCHAIGVHCIAGKCSCSKLCQNGKNVIGIKEEKDEHDDEKDEKAKYNFTTAVLNTVEENKENENFNNFNNTFLATPQKMLKRSTLTFDTPSVKGGFFTN